ncbi:PQQ-binding-like beta-propeller repeat protein [Magnetospira sp. QH-2]|uniref:outer membrane protein assembly factor BamB family protein n=1 Tax=Magnetospira sp. (strain QH-2) TaxID=1288970 RepID=UPI0003E81A73|nr:PQQ-binding-like beta-propeller repeat protein [Magnetospira sp. QH-2]CCQ73731.1 putative FoxY [Magnetospira sp. QH-2]
MHSESGFKRKPRHFWRRCVLGIFMLTIAASSVAIAQEKSGEQTSYSVLARWATDNTSLRPVTYDDDVLYVAGDISVEAWDTRTGTRIWRHTLDDGADFRPRLTGNAVIVTGRKFIIALARHTGDVLWSLYPEQNPNDPFEPVATPLVHDERVFLGVGPMMTALGEDGAVVWERATHQRKGIWYAPTVFEGNTILFGPGDGILYALDYDTGAVKWTLDNAKKWQYLRQLHVSDKVLVAGGYKDNLFGVDLTTGTLKWDWYSGNFINSHLVHEGAAYLWSPTGWVYCLDVESGKVNWRTKSDYFPNKKRTKRPWAPVLAELVARGTALYILDMQNILHILDTQTGKERRSISFHERLRPFIVPAPKSPRLFMGSAKGEILYIELNEESSK